MLGFRAPQRVLFTISTALLSAVAIVAVGGGFFEPFNVTYDHRALIIGGKRRMLISAGFHYPRATPEMWPGIILKSKEGGADVIQTYVFWDGHEPVSGQYYFEGRYDLVKFVKLIGSSGLYLHLRIGPYACAEWNFGGFPVWLRDIQGIEFRTNNGPFKHPPPLDALAEPAFRSIPKNPLADSTYLRRSSSLRCSALNVSPALSLRRSSLRRFNISPSVGSTRRSCKPANADFDCLHGEVF